MTKLCKISKDISAVLLGFLLLNVSTGAPAHAEDSENVNFSGVYEGKQAIPNSMAILCQMDGKTMVEEQLTKGEVKDEKEAAKPSTLKKCLDKIIGRINVEEAATRAENIKEFDNIIQEQRVQMMVEGVGKLAVVSQYAKRNDDTLNSAGEAKTVSDDTAALANADANLTDVINTLGTLYATEAKYLALDALKLVDPAVLAEEKEKEEKEAHNDGKSEVTETVLTGHATADYENPEDQSAELTSSDAYDGDNETSDGYVEDPNAQNNYDNAEEGEQETEQFEGEEIIGEYNPSTGKCKTAETEQWGACGTGRYSYGTEGLSVWCDGSSCSNYLADVVVTGHQN